MSTTIQTKVKKVNPLELEQLSKKIKEAFPDGVSFSNITDVVIDGMSMVGQIQNMAGESKKQLVIDMIIYLINNTDSGPFEVFEPLVLNVVPNIIDSLIDVEKGKLRFNNKIKKGIIKMFTCCC